MKPLKSVEEASWLLGISPWTVRSYIRKGMLKPVRLGRRVLVEEAELERFVAEGKAIADTKQPDLDASIPGAILRENHVG
jgi:excisionase family DNA binding protein